MLPALRHPNCAGTGRSFREYGQKYETTLEQERVDCNVVELLALDRNLGEEYRKNVAAKKAAEERSHKKHRNPETWKEHWVAFKDLLTLKNSLFVFVSNSDCGGYISTLTSGIISTPNYPNNYNDNMLCIWLIVAPVNYYISLTLPELQMEGTRQDGCLDYLEIRAGSAISSLLFYDCNVTTSTIVKSTSQWLWIKVKSSESNTYRGFQATWELRAGGLSNKTNPVIACQWTHFMCANKECISRSWLCDKWNDCGCTSGCDEDECGGLNYAYTTLLAIGLGSGFVTFVIIIVVIITWDYYQKKKAKRQEEERQKEAVSRKRKQDNMKAVILTTEAITGNSKSVLGVNKDGDKSRSLTPIPDVK
ncbi:hypothetical protein LSH36_638g01005 [Paralvinella palmiformis]|uniref:CUB domain-containing protein n=1 Tax=Paralvinella palmiformis TaxID=53620 RepID=A0AAD9J445_9ANNE|nr:hypothetical protein LSH36_638g01005 [Paralvinella palmiformis]